jgi:3-methyladenine DNA glycosylase/8-oxoguanine DNA glycosylase
VFTEKHRVEFSAVPPYNFELSVHKPAGWWWSTPNEVFQNGALWATVRLDSRLFGLKLVAAGASRKPKVCCSVFSDKKMIDQDKDNATSMVRRALGVDEDINEFYAVARKDAILRETVEALCGMRTVAWPELFSALILAVTLQMAPMKRSNQMMSLLISNFGETITFNGKTIAHWPSPEKIAELKSDGLRNKAKLGYRAENLISIAKTLRDGFPTTDELAKMPPEEAKKQLMALRGVGEYSAEIVMPGMGFPLDVWSAKIFSILLLGKEPESPRDAIPELKRIAKERWGEWRGHVFVYVLNDLPRISKRLGIDLTRF